jgi:hypothetical protein
MEKWRLDAYEAWFSDMAREGLLVQELLDDKVRFVAGEPQEAAYRLLGCANVDRDQAIRRSAKRGWELVCVYQSRWQKKSRALLVLRAKPGASALKMSPEERDEISRRIQTSSWNRFILIMSLVFLMVIYDRSAGLSGLSEIIWLSFTGGVILLLCAQAAAIFRALRRWKDPASPQVTPSWRRQRLYGKIFIAALGALWLGLFTVILYVSLCAA